MRSASSRLDVSRDEVDVRPLYEQPLPEVRLWLSVIAQAQNAALGDLPSSRNAARNWIEGEGLENVCNMLGLDVEAVREASRADW